MQKSSSQKALKVVSIIMIVLAALTIAGGLFMTIGGGALAGSSIDAADETTAVMAGIAMLGGFMLLFGGIVNLIVGLFGLRGANNPQKIGVFFVLAIIGTVLSALSFIGTLMSGYAEASSILSGLASLVLPIVCVVLAYNIKKENTR